MVTEWQVHPAEWWRRLARREPDPPLDARGRRNRQRAQAVLAQVRAEGQTERYLRALAPFVALAPEVLALGPVPASLTMRVLFGLCTFRGERLQSLLDTVAAEAASASPTMRAVRRDGLICVDAAACVEVTPRGRELFQRLVRVGAYDDME